MDIHLFDGKLYKSPQHYSQESSRDHKQSLLTLLHTLIQEKKPTNHDYGSRGIVLIQNDISLPPNFNTPDNVYAEDIIIAIYILLLKVTDESVVISVLEEMCLQFKDMFDTNGLCPIGRCRNIQILMFLEDYCTNLQK